MSEIQEDDRFMMPGKIYDVVRQHRDIPFDIAKHLIQKSKIKVIESSGNLFHECFTPLSDSEAHEILQHTYRHTKKDSLKLKFLSRINKEGIYESSSTRFYGSSSERLNIEDYEVPEILPELECYYEAIIKSLSDGQTSLQGFNLINNPRSILKTMPYHTSPNINPRLEAKHGINIPIFRLGTRASFEEMHKSFGLLDRADVLHWGAPRLWLVVQLNFQRALELRLSNHLARRGGYPSWCAMPTYHKDFMIAPSLLRKWNIPFEIVVQMPGDLVHLRDWVPHQVIDLGTNISETVSVGSAEWNMSTSKFLNCPCDTKHHVGDNNFGGNPSIRTKVELMVKRSKPMPCIHVAQAIEAAKKEFSRENNVVPAVHGRFLPSDHDRVPVLKEYYCNSKSRCKSNKCYGCGKRCKNLKSHLSRHIVCRAKLNLAADKNDDEEDEEVVTDESEEELECVGNVTKNNQEARHYCSYCRSPFDLRRLVNAHVEKMHRSKLTKRSGDAAGPIVKKRKLL